MRLSLDQLLRVPQVDSGYGFDVSPDGSRIAFSWNRSGAWELYEMLGLPWTVMSNSVVQHARTLTRPPGGKFHPRYSPDGKRLAYALDLDGSESYHIVVLDLASGIHADLTPDINFAHQPNMSWSPDGQNLAVLSDAKGQFALYKLPVDGSKPQLLLDIGHPCWDAHWSPDGNWIAVEVEWHQQDRSIFLVNVHDGHARQLQEDGRVLNAMHPAWATDGRALAFCAEAGGWQRIGLHDLASETVRWLAGNGREDTNPAWSPDGNRVACVRTKGADTCLCVHSLPDNTVRSYRLDAGVYSHPCFTPDGRQLLFIFDNPRSPDDLWQLDFESEAFTQLTHSLPDDIDTSRFVMPEEVWYPSTDGVMVPAMLYRSSVQDSPALINIHGGPNWLFQCRWHPLMSYLADQGWTVLAPNYRGSTGYGRAWAQANHLRLGEADTSDCAAGAQYLMREGLAHPDKIVVSGRSHGGYLTMTCLTEHPELWRAGSAVVPFLNWFTCHANARADLQHWDIENFGDPVENAELWRRRSPFFRLDRIDADVQLICGGNDPRCPASESIAARDRLQELGKRVELILYPDEGHGFLKTGNIIDQETRRLHFLEQAAIPGGFAPRQP